MAPHEDIGDSVVRVGRGEVIAFRLHAHHLTERRPADELRSVAGACAVQNSPPGSALLALGARVEGVTQGRIDHLEGEAKSLLQTWCMRGSPFYFPTVDAPVFTTGVLPATETVRMHLILGVEHALHALDMSLDEAVEHIETYSTHHTETPYSQDDSWRSTSSARHWPSASPAPSRRPSARRGRRSDPMAPTSRSVRLWCTSASGY